jgi:hypothetical protein
VLLTFGSRGLVAPDNRVTLTEEQLDRLADRVAIRLAAAKPPAKPMLTVEDICITFQVSRAWVYENAGRLGGCKLGTGRRAPLRFDSEQVVSVLRPLAAPVREDDQQKPGRASGVQRKRARNLHPVYDG